MKPLDILIADLEKQPQAVLAVSVHDGEYSVAYEFGKEADDSPMYGGASYGIDPHLETVLLQVVDECGLKVRS